MKFTGHPRMRSLHNRLLTHQRAAKRRAKFLAAREAEAAAGHISNRPKKA